jgi:hypothetical protein
MLTPRSAPSCIKRHNKQLHNVQCVVGIACTSSRERVVHERTSRMLAMRLISLGSYTFTLMNKNSSRYIPYIVFRLTTSMLCMRRRLEYELWLRFDVANLAFVLLKLSSRSSNATSKLGNRLKRKDNYGCKDLTAL